MAFAVQPRSQARSKLMAPRDGRSPAPAKARQLKGKGGDSPDASFMDSTRAHICSQGHCVDELSQHLCRNVPGHASPQNCQQGRAAELHKTLDGHSPVPTWHPHLGLGAHLFPPGSPHLAASALFCLGFLI